MTVLHLCLLELECVTGLRSLHMCTRAHACPPVCTRMPTGVHTHAQGRTHALQADSSHGSLLWPVLGAAPVPLASFTNSPLCPSTLLTPPWEEGLCLPSTPEPIRLPTHTGQIPSWDPHKLQRPRSYLKTSALQASRRQGCEQSARDTESTPHTGAPGAAPREGTDSLAAAASVRALWLCESGRCRGGADLVAHLQVQEHIY